MVDVFTQDDLDRAVMVAKAHAGGRYIWGGCRREGSDCSGFMSICYNSIIGEHLYTRRFATGYFQRVADMLGFKPGLGDDNDFSLGLIFPWETRSGIGHVAGTLGVVAVESRGSRGVLVGSAARSARDGLFRHHYHLTVKDGANKPPIPPFPGYLRRGSRGRGVERYQSQMRHRGWRLDVDGQFGPRTYAVTVSFQREKKLEVDGIVGPETWRAAFTSKITK